MPPKYVSPSVALVESLDDTRVRQLLIEAADGHPDIYARLQALACPPDLDALVDAARARVGASFDGFNWNRDWKYVGDRIEKALTEFCEDRPDSLTRAAAVLVALEDIAEGSRDYYGALSMATAQWLSDLDQLERTELPDEAWSAIAQALVDLAVAPGTDGMAHLREVELEDGRTVDDVLVSLFDEEALDDLDERIGELERELARLEATAKPAHRGAAAALDRETFRARIELGDITEFRELLTGGQ